MNFYLHVPKTGSCHSSLIFFMYHINKYLTKKHRHLLSQSLTAIHGIESIHIKYIETEIPYLHISLVGQSQFIVHNKGNLMKECR